MEKQIELTKEENKILFEILSNKLKDIRNYQREAMLAGDILGVEESARTSQTIMIIMEKINKK